MQTSQCKIIGEQFMMKSPIELKDNSNKGWSSRNFIFICTLMMSLLWMSWELISLSCTTMPWSSRVSRVVVAGARSMSLEMASDVFPFAKASKYFPKKYRISVFLLIFHWLQTNLFLWNWERSVPAPPCTKNTSALHLCRAQPTHPCWLNHYGALCMPQHRTSSWQQTAAEATKSIARDRRSWTRAQSSCSAIPCSLVCTWPWKAGTKEQWRHNSCKICSWSLGFPSSYQGLLLRSSHVI